MKIKTITAALAGLALTATMAFAQSSGNFSATGTSAACAIGVGGALSGGTTATSFAADISTSNGNGTTLLIRPSLVTGLFTDTKISTTVPSASADIGIQVCVEVDGSGAGVLPTSCVIYDERFQQISSQLFSQLTACTAVPTTIACSATNPCPAGDTCNIPTGTTAGTCTTTNPLCNFELILSTLSAHSFDFVAPVGLGKPHVVTVNWSTVGAASNNTQGGSVASCVGPGIVTATQVKVFNNSGTLTF